MSEQIRSQRNGFLHTRKGENMTKNSDSESDYDRLKHLEKCVIELSHDARMTITTASGYAKLLARRTETLTEENRSDVVQRIITNLIASEETITKLMKVACGNTTDET
jgi:hypothetical protein